MDPNPVKVLLNDKSIILTNSDTSFQKRTKPGQQARDWETISAANRRKKDKGKREKEKKTKEDRNIIF